MKHIKLFENFGDQVTSNSSAEIEVPGMEWKKIVISGPAENYDQASSLLGEISGELEQESERYNQSEEQGTYMAVNYQDAMDEFIESSMHLFWTEKMAQLGYSILVEVME
jgi:hypothetical protein